MKSNDPFLHPTICIYHANCDDGFGAAWALHKAFPSEDITYVAAQYGEEPPDVTDEKVAIVDFSYKRPILEKMAEEAADILVLDHHKTAQAELEPILNTFVGDTYIRGIFDMNQSGAVLTWRWFHDTPVPRLLRYVQDRDLWRFELNGSKEISAWLRSYPHDFDVWDRLSSMLFDRDSGSGIPPTIFAQGAAILRYQEKTVQSALEHSHTMKIGSWKVPVVHVTTLISETANALCVKDVRVPFAAAYFMVNNGKDVVFSLRSDEDGIDVSEVAKQYGGGGHKHAAGFKVKIEAFLNML